MSKHLDFYKNNEAGHRRTYSNNIDNIKGLNSGHRRTMSNTAYDFASFNIQSLPVAKEEPLTPESFDSFKVLPQKKKKGFVSLVNAAISYFNQEAQFPIIFPPSEIDILKQQLEKLKTSYKEIEKGNNRLEEEYEEIGRGLIEEQKIKKRLEGDINELKKCASQLEGNLKKLHVEIRQEVKKSEEIMFLEIEKDKVRFSPQNHGHEDAGKRIMKKNSDIDRPMPRPINYKPITQRGIRNSRDALRK